MHNNVIAIHIICLKNWQNLQGKLIALSAFHFMHEAKIPKWSHLLNRKRKDFKLMTLFEM